VALFFQLLLYPGGSATMAILLVTILTIVFAVTITLSAVPNHIPEGAVITELVRIENGGAHAVHPVCVFYFPPLPCVPAFSQS
jgi:hypothetical protein